MPSVNFWRALERLGSWGASLALWRHEMQGDVDAAMPFLTRIAGVADQIRDPDNPALWLNIYPTESDEVYMAVCADLDDVWRTPLEVPASDLALYAPDWEAIRPALATALGFIPNLTCVAHSSNIRQLGFVQPEVGVTVPVYLHIPESGILGEPQVFLTSLCKLPPCILYSPGHLNNAEILAIARERHVVLEPIITRLGSPQPAATSLSIASAAAVPKSEAMLAVQPGWIWEQLRIRLTVKGSLIVQYGTTLHSPRGERCFALSEDTPPKYPAWFSLLFQICLAGHWKNPARWESNYEAVRKNFSRLRQQLQSLICIPGDPFHRQDGAWIPRFIMELDKELTRAMQYKKRRDEDEDEE